MCVYVCERICTPSHATHKHTHTLADAGEYLTTFFIHFDCNTDTMWSYVILQQGEALKVPSTTVFPSLYVSLSFFMCVLVGKRESYVLTVASSLVTYLNVFFTMCTRCITVCVCVCVIEAM